MRFLKSCCAFCLCLASTLACRRNEDSQFIDHPRLTSNVSLRDVTFRSAALGRDMQYRAISPLQSEGQKLPVVYLLHGGGGGFRDWSNYSDVARFAESGLLLVMPEGESSYYTNAVDPPQNRFEDYITRDLIADVESRFPVATGRAKRAIIGNSMGGFGAVKIALRHPAVCLCGRYQFCNRCAATSILPQTAAAIAPLQFNLWIGRKRDSA